MLTDFSFIDSCFLVYCAFLVLSVFRSKDGGSLLYLDRYVSDLTMFSGFCK